MLQAINDRIKGWLGIVVVVLIGLPFGLWGIQSYLDNSGPRYAAKVNKIEISVPELEQAVSLQRQRLMQRFQGKLPIKEKALRKQVLDQLINQHLLAKVSYEQGFRISDSVLAAEIKQMFSIGGKFNRNAMEARLASIGRTPKQFEYQLRSELRVQQMQAALTNSTIVSKPAVRQMATLEQQQRDVSIITFNADKFAGDYQPTKAEIQHYYETHQQRFMNPEKVKVDYVEFTTAKIAAKATIDEDKVKAAYDDYVSSVKNREQREAAHILITAGKTAKDKAAAKAKITDIKKQLEAGKSFAELAKKYSQDPESAKKGGELGWISSGDMVKPFEDALFTMKKGTVSHIVKTRFGYHLIKLEDIRKQKVLSLAQKRAEIERELRNQVASDQFYDLSEKLANKAFENPDSLDEVVESMHAKLHTSDYFTRQHGTGIAGNKKVRQAAFSSDVLNKGVNSDVIELTPKDIVVIRLNNYVKAQPEPLAEVSAKIQAILKIKSGYRKTLTAVSEVQKKLASGASIDSISGNGIVVSKTGVVSRTDFSKVSEPSLIKTIFDMPVPLDGKLSTKRSFKRVDLLTGDVALIVLNKIIDPDKISKDKLAVARNELRRQIAMDEFKAVLQSIKAKADIDINNRVLQ